MNFTELIDIILLKEMAHTFKFKNIRNHFIQILMKKLTVEFKYIQNKL